MIQKPNMVNSFGKYLHSLFAYENVYVFNNTLIYFFKWYTIDHNLKLINGVNIVNKGSIINTNYLNNFYRV